MLDSQSAKERVFSIGGVGINDRFTTDGEKGADAAESEPGSQVRRGGSPVRYRDLFHQAADGILVSDASGRYIDVNEKACELLSYSVAELTAMRVDELIEASDIERRPLALATLQRGDSLVLERVLKCGDGRRLTVDVSARVLADGLVVAIIRDISKRKRAEARLQDYMALLDTIRGLQSRFISEPQPKLIFELMLRSFLRQTKSEYGFIGEVAHDDSGRPYLITRCINATSWNAERRRDVEAAMGTLGLELRELDTLFGSVLLVGAPVISNDPMADPRHSTLPPGHPSLQNFMGLPLYVGGRLVGCVGLVNREGGYSSELPDLLEPLAATCGSLLEGLLVRAERKTATELAARLGRILDQTSGEILVFAASDLRFFEANQGARDALGYSLEELCKLSLLDLLPHISREHLLDILDGLTTGRQSQVTFETMQRTKEGASAPVEVRLSYSEAEEQGLFVVIMRDITQRKQVEGRLSYLVHYDALTGLPNRLLLADRLEQALLEADWDKLSVAVLSLDVDRFKTINDTLGHEVGDRVLSAFAERLKGVVPRGGTLARLGGDEFTVLVGGVQHPEEAARVAQRIIETSHAPLDVDGRDFFVTASIGITLYPEDAKNAISLMQRADTALHASKEEGRGSYQFFTAGMQQQVADQLSVETRLRRALERGELDVFYQPKVSVRGGNLVGAEALVRWRPDGAEAVPPNRFIALAEDNGMIVPIGRFVLVRACQTCASWRAAGHDVSVSVNLSLRQIRPGLVVEVSDALERSGLPPEALELELTESALMRDPAAVEELKHLHAMGVKFSLDDFGTGYSSMSYIKRFNVDVIKIDRSFVSGVCERTEDAAIARAIVAMAHSLGLSVVAEGVETEGQLAFLAGEGCDAYQGFLYSPAVCAAEFEAILARDRTPPTLGHVDGHGSRKGVATERG